MTESCGPAEATAEDAQRACDAMYAATGADFSRRYRAWREVEQTQAACKRAAARQPEPPQVQSAWQAYADIRAAEVHQLEAMGGAAEIGTDAGERYGALGWDAHHAYGRYLDVYSAAHPPEPNPEADARAAIDEEFCRQHADQDGHALIWAPTAPTA
jgi:hypothetical protein